ncbi:hypothetical protein SporoP37_04925 [Sporosarcina sp. P37]|uniref:hypothetical protein n=1 Tax=unclassified Sporosarcina TaxID=2647733 RepID=UPI000A17CF93|nr:MULTISPECIES: hypothetical protein [unclassified Sporosarcina]ARK24089.1 hypothetical protein SporoP37_04925 [Sporosarcina sp. P37]PID18518.1 hypothetical protein CSV62_07655 [Sporosarcina sp. P35]
MFILLFLTVFVLAMAVKKLGHKPVISTVAGAPLMSMGIAWKSVGSVYFPAANSAVFYVIILGAFWILIHYLFDVFQKDFYLLHVEDPISSFSIGTWIASVSIILILLSDKNTFGSMEILFYINFTFWLLYIGLVIRNYMFIFTNLKKYIQQIHGGLLLTCVSTQSIVISGYHVFDRADWTGPAGSLLIIGSLFYILNFLLIVYRYASASDKDLTVNWINTNCILHGAISITGVALTLAYPAAPSLIYIVWILSFIFFLVIEIIEIIWAFQRIRKLGWRQGIFVYSPTQWARVFTFGMFLFFTEQIPAGQHQWIDLLAQPLQFFLPAVIVLLIIAEVTLMGLQIYRTLRADSTEAFV